MYHTRVHTLFWTKNSRTFQGLSRTNFPFFKHSIQHQKEPRVYDIFSSSTTWANLSWRSFCVCSFSFGLDKVSIKIQGLASTDSNSQRLSRPWIFILKFKDFQGACEPCHTQFLYLIVLFCCCLRVRQKSLKVCQFIFKHLFSVQCILKILGQLPHFLGLDAIFILFWANNTYEYYSCLSRW